MQCLDDNTILSHKDRSPCTLKKFVINNILLARNEKVQGYIYIDLNVSRNAKKDLRNYRKRGTIINVQLSVRDPRRRLDIRSFMENRMTLRIKEGGYQSGRVPLE